MKLRCNTNKQVSGRNTPNSQQWRLQYGGETEAGEPDPEGTAPTGFADDPRTSNPGSVTADQHRDSIGHEQRYEAAKPRHSPIKSTTSSFLKNRPLAWHSQQDQQATSKLHDTMSQQLRNTLPRLVDRNVCGASYTPEGTTCVNFVS